MYSVDEKDSVVAMSGLPLSCTGAPLPVVLATEHKTFLAYVVDSSDTDWDGSSAHARSLDSGDQPLAVFSFNSCWAHFFGPPNDETFHGHPLSDRGLRPYGVFRIENSSWLRALEQMNSVHPRHSPKMFSSLSHFIFAFHDSTFECIAESFNVTTNWSSIRAAMSELADQIS
ncbi:hypothetical protein [Pelagibius sp.]|uniref:hypothetical protein n=1 Tax=Pelagibius sp. TaxID=1931238 RepID=UPI002605CE23|nr:hypothetical protein [Pelagibius sp.]